MQQIHHDIWEGQTRQAEDKYHGENEEDENISCE